LKVTVERTPESEALLNVELEWSELEKASDRAYHKLVQKYNVPGFRRGHAPRSMLERMLGADALYLEGLDDLIDESVRSAVREHHLRPLARPEVETHPIAHGQPYSFTARLPVLSPVGLGDYKSIRVEQPAVEVTEDEVNKVLDDLQQNNALWLPAERPAQIGDKALVDLNVTVGDRTISDLHDNEFELASERHGIFAGMDAEIVGMKEGDTKEFTTTIPEDYANTELAGKEAHFSVTLKGVKYRELPAIDDELAKSVGEFSTVDELRKAIYDQLLERKQTQARRELRDSVVKAATEQAKVEIHPVLVDDEVHTMMHETERSLAQSRLSLQQYLSMTNKTEEQYHTELEPEARERVKRDMVLSAIADAENIGVTDEEIEGWLMVITAVGGGKPIRLRDLKDNQRANVEARIRRDKAWERLVEIATEGAGESTGEAAEAPATTPATVGTKVSAETSAAVSAETSAAVSAETSAAVSAETSAAVSAETSERNAKTAASAAAGVEKQSAETAAGPAAKVAKAVEPVAEAPAPAASQAAAPTPPNAEAPAKTVKTTEPAETKPAASAGTSKKRAKNTEVPESTE
jgi:trigger factor